MSLPGGSPVIAALLAGVMLLTACGPERTATQPKASGPLEQRAYVWQREWNESVRGAIAQRGGEFAGLAVLGAQICGNAAVVRPAIAWDVLETTGKEAAAVIRVEPGVTDPQPSVVEEARRLLSASEQAGVKLAEIQVDYDSPQKKLAGYTAWLRKVERALEPLPVRITTLASWLSELEFRALIDACDGYILQVHSFDRPPAGKRPAVCDTGKARVWVKQAAALGKPFSVALPTYRTTAGYDASGKLIGVATDSPVSEWPPGTVRYEFPSDPAALAELVAEWLNDRPAQLQGIYWYRFPVPTDTRNWRWPALAAVMSGRAPLSKLEVKLSGGQPLDVVLSNSGEQDEWLPQAVTVSWSGPAPAAGDGVAGWSFSAETGRAAFFPTSQPAARLLPAGQFIALGWLRFYEPAPPLTEIHTTVGPAHAPTTGHGDR